MHASLSTPMHSPCHPPSHTRPSPPSLSPESSIPYRSRNSATQWGLLALHPLTCAHTCPLILLPHPTPSGTSHHPHFQHNYTTLSSTQTSQHTHCSKQPLFQPPSMHPHATPRPPESTPPPPTTPHADCSHTNTPHLPSLHLSLPSPSCPHAPSFRLGKDNTTQDTAGLRTKDKQHNQH